MSDPVQELVDKVRSGEPGAQAALAEFIEQAAAPYLKLARSVESSDTTFQLLLDTAQESIQSGALLRAEFLTSFVQTLAWQHIKQSVPSATRPGWDHTLVSGGVLIPRRTL